MKKTCGAIFLVYFLFITDLSSMEEITRPDVPTRVKEAVDIPWKYLRFYMYSWDCYGAGGVDNSGRLNTQSSIKTYSPALGDCIYSILYDPESSLEDIRQILTIPTLAREANNVQRGKSGGTLTMPAVYKTEAAEVYSRFLNNAFESTFQVLERNGYLQQAFKVASIYKEKEPAKADVLLERIRQTLVTKIEDIALTVQSLETFPELQAQHHTQAVAILHSFPEGHELRSHLQQRFEAILAAPRPVVSDEADLHALRGIADRLFG